MSQSNALLKAALMYAKNGWHVFPCKPKSKIPLIGKSEGGNGCLDATTDPNQINTWWTACPDANIGLLCGEKSGVAVVDIDVKDGKNGWDTLKRFPDLPDTIMQMTPTGGAHKIYRVGNVAPPKNRNGFPTKQDGIDIRSTNYYIMLAPSIHPDTGTEYCWANGFAPWEIGIATFPDFMRPENQKTEKSPAPHFAQIKNDSTPIIERARLYLNECEPAVQGQAGHDSLLWAARALVIGFELDEATAISLLWEEFNPRCVPPWDQLSPAAVKDFERKVRQVQITPGTKPRGWLLDEYALRTDDEALLAMGAQSASNLLASYFMGKLPANGATTLPDKIIPEAQPFPSHCFPRKIQDFILQISDVQVVDPAGVGLSVLVAAGAAMGNAFRLRLKKGFEVCPTLWGVIVAPSGSNKTGIFGDIVEPLRPPVPLTETENQMLTPPSELLIEDVTTEAVIGMLEQSPRGLLLVNGELSGWATSFDRYSKGKKGADESIWLKMYDAKPYSKNRKTNNERIFVPAAAVSVLGAIQPKRMAECFDPSQFDSGLVPRLLIVKLPRQLRLWSEREMDEAAYDLWCEVVVFLRSRPFKEIKLMPQQFMPNVLELEHTAMHRYIDEFNRIAHMTHEGDERTAIFTGKVQGAIGRIALVLHGLYAAVGEADMLGRISRRCMEHAIELMQYFLNEQLRLFGMAADQYEKKRSDDVLAWLRGKGGRTTARLFQKNHKGRYPKVNDARTDLDRLVQQGKLKREGNEYVCV